jgi:hypothetical protein
MPTYEFTDGYPGGDTARAALDDAAYQRALIAYRFWYPTVSNEGIFNGNCQAGIEDNVAIGARPGRDRIPGPDRGKGGTHIVLPPDFDGEEPSGAFVERSASFKALIALRALPLGGDLAKATEALTTVKIHRLGDEGAPLSFVDTTERELESTCLAWEDNLEFWRVLHRVLEAEPTVEEYRPMHGLLAGLGIGKGEEFAPDERMTAILERAARDGRDQMLVSAFASERADRVAWSDRHWEWVGLVPGNADFETPAGLDLGARDRWFAQAIVASPAMFRRQEGAGSLYWLATRDGDGAYLDGGRNYRLEIPTPVPGKLFWSLTVYDAQTRSQVQTDQDKAALRSLFELSDLDPGAESVELFVGPDAPDAGADRWIKTTAGRGWFAYVRIYGPEAPAFDGSWKLADFVAAD